MSKFQETFDGIEAGEELKRDTLDRIKKDKKAASNRLSSSFSRKPLKRWKVALISVAAVLAVIMAFPSYLAISNAAGNPRYNFSKALPVKTESRLTSLLNKEEFAPVTFFNGLRMSPAEGDMATSESAGSPGIAKGDAAHSSTNVQVQGMDEGDIIKNDGQYIYRLSSGGFDIVKADNGRLEKVCEVPIENFVPNEMYIRGGLLVLIGGGYNQLPYYGIEDLKDGGYMSCMSYHTNVQIRVFDLSDIANPAEARFYQMEGYYHTSRISEADGTLYFVINYYNGYYRYSYDGLGAEDAQARRPYCRDDEDGDAEPLPIEDIYYFKNVPVKSYMILGAIDLEDASKPAQIKAYLSCANITYVSGENLYTSAYQHFYDVLGRVSSIKSYIAKFSLSDLGYKGSGKVMGAPKDRYCLDEYNGYLRVATSYETSVWASAVYVFDKNMKEVGKITGIAPGEAIDSASFSGDKGYISTSVRRTFDDPIFIIDFSDVKHPVISPEGLKEEGVNSYMKAIDGSDYTLGFGTEPDGLKVQLYDMSGPKARSVKRLSIQGNSSYAEALYNPKALLYMYDKENKTGLIGLAAEQAEYSYQNNYRYAVKCQGLFLYSFDLNADDDNKLKETGLLSNFPTDTDVYAYSYNGYKYEDALKMYSKYVKRGIVIGGYIYTAADSVIAAYDLGTLAKTAELQG